MKSKSFAGRQAYSIFKSRSTIFCLLYASNFPAMAAIFFLRAFSVFLLIFGISYLFYRNVENIECRISHQNNSTNWKSTVPPNCIAGSNFKKWHYTVLCYFCSNHSDASTENGDNSNDSLFGCTISVKSKHFTITMVLFRM